MWFVYVLLCKDGSLRPSGRKLSLYTGYTNNIEQRFSEHKSGKGGRYTRSHKPIKLIYQEQFNTKSEALKKEAQIKSWSRKKKIKTLKLKF